MSSLSAALSRPGLGYDLDARGQSSGDSRAALAASLSSAEALRRALRVANAYGNVLAACTSSGPRGRSVPSLAEVSSRQIGWALEEEVCAALDESGDSESSSADDEGRGGWEQPGEEDEPDLDSSFSSEGSILRELGVAGLKGAEIEAEHQRLVEEWYESVPDYCRRWLLSAHATSLVLRSLSPSTTLPPTSSAALDEEGFDAPCALLQVLFETALTRDPTAATHFHLPFLHLIFYPIPPHTPTVPPFLIALLRMTPSPSSLLQALKTTLLSSSFSSRLFFSPSLSLYSKSLPNRKATTLESGDEPLAAGLFGVLAEVGKQMLRAISEAIEEDEPEDEGEEGLRKMADEVLTRMMTQTRAILGFLVPTALAVVSGRGRELDTGEAAAGTALIAVEEALGGVLDECARMRWLGEGEQDEEGGNETSDVGALSELGNLHQIVQLVGFLSSPLTSPFPSSISLSNYAEDDFPPSLESALQKYVFAHLCPTSLFSLCDRLLTPTTTTTTLPTTAGLSSHILALGRAANLLQLARFLLAAALRYISTSKKSIRGRGGGREVWQADWIGEEIRVRSSALDEREEEEAEKLILQRGDGQEDKQSISPQRRQRDRQERAFELSSSSSTTSSRKASSRRRPSHGTPSLLSPTPPSSTRSSVPFIATYRSGRAASPPPAVADSICPPASHADHPRPSPNTVSQRVEPFPAIPPSPSISRTQNHPRQRRCSDHDLEILDLASASPPPSPPKPQHESPPSAAQIWQPFSLGMANAPSSLPGPDDTEEVDDDELDLIGSFRSPPAFLASRRRRLGWNEQSARTRVEVGEEEDQVVRDYEGRRTSKESDGRWRTSPSLSPSFAPPSATSSSSNLSAAAAASECSRDSTATAATTRSRHSRSPSYRPDGDSAITSSSSSSSSSLSSTSASSRSRTPSNPSLSSRKRARTTSPSSMSTSSSTSASVAASAVDDDNDGLDDFDSFPTSSKSTSHTLDSTKPRTTTLTCSGARAKERRLTWRGKKEKGRVGETLIERVPRGKDDEEEEAEDELAL
ncbi:hypothetical protein JCM11641_000006 [Rhodosporidiobolus odoratus]